MSVVALPPKFINVSPLIPGKNATVFKARNNLVGRDVFLKLYPISTGDADSALREPRLLTQLEHENLARIYGADELDGGIILLEMELVTGGSFSQMIDNSMENGTWPSIHSCIDLVSDAAMGLSQLHRRGIVHRDVKPANLLIRQYQGGRKGVVADLGLAGTLDGDGRAFASQHARIYRPPEVWRGRGYSVRSDIYQLGIVLFQLLGGELNYAQGELSDEALSTRSQNGRIINISSIGADVDLPLRRIIAKAIAPEDERYSSMSDFQLAINNVKTQQLNWSYCVTGEGFTIERSDGDTMFRVEIAVEGDSHRIVRKCGRNGKFRRKNPVLEIKHDDIGSCRDFRRAIKW